MPLYAGFDEAGYGPLLGPMAIGCTAWNCPSSSWSDSSPPNLWKALSHAVCRRPADKRGRIAIADSKTLKGKGGAERHPAAMMERGVLSALCAMGTLLPEDDHALAVALGAVPIPAAAPWHPTQVAFPLDTDRADIGLAAHTLKQVAKKANFSLHSMRATVLPVDLLNDSFDRGISKPSIPFSAALEMATALIREATDDQVWLAFDRQGGKMLYRDDLARAFPTTKIRIETETPLESRYELRVDGRVIKVTFTVGAESQHLPTALASMTAKYLRELWMERFNRFFHAVDENLRPTAGYVEDGRRFLVDAENAIAKCGLVERELVRSR